MKKYLLTFASIITVLLLVLSIPSESFASIAVGWNATSTDPGFISPTKVNGNNPGITVTGKVGIGTTSPITNLSVVGNQANYGAYAHFGLAAPLSQCNTVLGASSCIELVGDDNTIGGVGIYEANRNSGTSAYGGYVLTNDLTGNATTNYSGLFLNSSTYTDTSFGTSATVPSLLELANTMGPISIQSFATTSANSYINFYANAAAAGSGLPATAEGMRLNSTGLGIGTTSPGSLLSIGNTNGINFTTATSTFNSTGGVNLASGCFAIAGTCVGGSAFVNTLANGGTATTTFYSGGVVFSDSNKLTQAAGSGAGSFTWDNTNNRLGVGTTSPAALISINPTAALGSSNALAIGSSTGSTFTVGNNGQTTITNNSANALAVGPTGTTNPVLKIDASTASGVTGVSIKNAATGGFTAIQALDSAADSGLQILSKGNGNLNMNVPGGGTFNIATGGNGVFSTNGTFIAFSGQTTPTATNKRFSFAGAADTGLTASTEAPSVVFDMSQTRQHATGAIATQRDFRIAPSTHSFATGGTNAASTIASTSALSIDGPPVQGAQANFTNAIGLYIGAGTAFTSASTTNAFGLVIQAPTGAANNYAASSSGRQVMNGLTTSAGIQSVILCGNAATGGEVIAESVACVASAARYKTDIKTLDGSLAELMQLRPVSFKWKADFNKGFENDPNKTGTQYSLIADEVQKVDPNLVIVTTGTTTFEGKTYAPGTIQGLQDSNHWAAFLVEAIQEQQKEIESLGGGKPMHGIEDNWQDIIIGLLLFGFFWQQVQINKLKK